VRLHAGNRSDILRFGGKSDEVGGNPSTYRMTLGVWEVNLSSKNEPDIFDFRMDWEKK